jgi:hypothetical protein
VSVRGKPKRQALELITKPTRAKLTGGDAGRLLRLTQGTFDRELSRPRYGRCGFLQGFGLAGAGWHRFYQRDCVHDPSATGSRGNERCGGIPVGRLGGPFAAADHGLVWGASASHGSQTGATAGWPF